jgi:hypothetical protein
LQKKCLFLRISFSRLAHFLSIINLL